MGDEATTANRPKLFTRDFAALLVANVCFGYAFSSYFLLPKFVVVALGGGPREIGYVAGLYGAAVVIFLPVMGAAVDRHGRRDYMTAGALVMAAASFGFAGVDSVGPLLYALRAAQGLAFAMAFAAAHPERVDQLVLVGAPAGSEDHPLPNSVRGLVSPVLSSLVVRLMERSRPGAGLRHSHPSSGVCGQKKIPSMWPPSRARDRWSFACISFRSSGANRPRPMPD